MPLSCPVFGRCGIPRLSPAHSPLATGLDADGHLHLAHSGAEVRGNPHLPKPGRYPYSCTRSQRVPRVRLSLKKAAWSSWKPTSFTGNTGYGPPVIRYGTGREKCGLAPALLLAAVRAGLFAGMHLSMDHLLPDRIPVPIDSVPRLLRGHGHAFFHTDTRRRHQIQLRYVFDIAAVRHRTA